MTADRILRMPTGETMTLLRTGSDTAGELFEFDAVLPPRFSGTPAHRHRFETETFTVVEGILRVRLGARTSDLTEGQSVTVPPETVHAFSNPTDEQVRVKTVETPAGPLEEQFRALVSSGRLPPLRALARINVAHELSFVLHGIPEPIQRFVWRALAALPAPKHK